MINSWYYIIKYYFIYL